jgi:hypothetical protein
MGLSVTLWATHGYGFPLRVGCAPPRRASQAPRLIFPRALPPTTPEGPASTCLFASPPGIRLHPSRRTGHLRIPIEAESGSLALRLACSPPEFASPIAKAHARSATCRTGNLHGELLSVHKISQAYPGIPTVRERLFTSARRFRAAGWGRCARRGCLRRCRTATLPS